MQRTLGRTNLIVKQARQYETDTRTPRAPHIGENFTQTRDRHSNDVAEDEDGGSDEGETTITHGVRPFLRVDWDRDRALRWRGVWGGAVGSPF